MKNQSKMAGQKKILHVVHSLAKGGITTFIEELVALNTASNTQHNILVWKTSPEEGYKFEAIDISKSSNIKESFISEIKNYDRIFVHSLMPFMIWKLFKRKSDVYLFQHGITFGSGKKKIVKQLYYFLVINSFRFKIVCSSKFAVKKLKSRVPILNNNLIKIIGFGITIKQPKAIKEQSDSILRIGFAGRLVEQKKISRIINALRYVKSDSQIEFHIAGDGPQFQKLQTDAKAFQNSKISFVFYGFLKNMDDFYDQLNLFILPSVGESFGLVVLEALSRQIPTIVFSDSGACVEFIEQGFNGYVVKSEEELSNKIDDFTNSELQVKLRQNIGTMNLNTYNISNTRSKLDVL